MQLLSSDEIRQHLAILLGRELVESWIQKSYAFPASSGAMGFVNRVADDFTLASRIDS